MIKHIVFWTFKDEALGKSGAENIEEAVERLSTLPDKIPQIKEFEAGRNVTDSTAAYELALYSVFDSLADLAIYRDHPAHQEVAAFIGKVVKERAVVDYKI
jgi:hypothetical protein